MIDIFLRVTAFSKKIGNSLVTLCFSHQIIKNNKEERGGGIVRKKFLELQSVSEV